MKKNLSKSLTGLFMVIPMLALAAGFFAPTICLAADGDITLGGGITTAHGEGQPEQLTGDTGLITTIINVLLFIVGIASVVMIIYSGIRYVTSGGNSNSVTAAKNSLIYAIVGLVVAIIAYALVNWVFTNVGEA